MMGESWAFISIMKTICVVTPSVITRMGSGCTKKKKYEYSTRSLTMNSDLSDYLLIIVFSTNAKIIYFPIAQIFLYFVQLLQYINSEST